jgi:hypothetical protein
MRQSVFDLTIHRIRRSVTALTPAEAVVVQDGEAACKQLGQRALARTVGRAIADEDQRRAIADTIEHEGGAISRVDDVHVWSRSFRLHPGNEADGLDIDPDQRHGGQRAIVPAAKEHPSPRGQDHPVEGLMVEGVVRCLGPDPEHLGCVVVPAHEALVIEVQGLLATVCVNLGWEADTNPLPGLAVFLPWLELPASNPGSARMKGIVR